jgi:hypothetical protein
VALVRGVKSLAPTITMLLRAAYMRNEAGSSM